MNVPSLIVLLILVIIVAAIITKMRNDKKRGKSSCGANCAHCALHGTCHKKH